MIDLQQDKPTHCKVVSANKPAFSTWEPTVLAELTHDLWDNNIALREANEQLRLDLKDAMKLARINYKEPQ